MKRETRFLVLFAVTLIGSFALIAWNPVNDHVIVPFTEMLTEVSAATLRLIGQPVEVRSTIMGTPEFLVDVKNGCNGVEAMLILLAAIVAFPASWKSRLSGLAIGSLVIQALNLVRIDSLYLLGLYHPRLFELFHGAIWQIAIVLVAVVYFLIWSRGVEADEPAPTATG